MNENFSAVSMREGNPKYSDAITREKPLYVRENDIRNEFYRDYTRILHSTAYRRLKHKTQVFFATHNDHVCTRIEHVNHVASISYTIANALNLNYELTNAIATGHDVGHAPFGHQGESVIKEITAEQGIEAFWHEKNSMFFIDNIETLLDENNKEKNLYLTYAVRDGIICHCGEIDQDKISPRDERIDLLDILEPNQVPPYTWEGCVVKIADKIAYLGRDIEDALLLGILDYTKIKQLKKILRETLGSKKKIKELNNANLIHGFITDLCTHSTPKSGLSFSEPYYSLLKRIKEFNYENIYANTSFDSFKQFVKLILKTIYGNIFQVYKTLRSHKPFFEQTRSNLLNKSFSDWLDKYSFQINPVYKNKKIFELSNEAAFKRSIIYFISGMTDNFALAIFNELNTF